MARIEAIDPGSGQTFEVSTGDELVLRLPENPTTGYRWRVSQSDSGDLEQTGDSFAPGSDPAVPGAGGARVLSFAASRAGTVILSLVLQRPWEASATTTKQITVVVR